MKIIDKIFSGVICIAFLASFSCCRLSSPMRTNLISKTSLEVIWNIDFQAGFFNDAVSLTVNNIPIFDIDSITSESTSGYAGVKVTCYKGENNLIPKFLHVFTPRTNEVINYNNLESDSLHLVLKVNTPSGLESTQKISIGKATGKYIGISKSQGDAVVIYIRQNNQPFLYY